MRLRGYFRLGFHDAGTGTGNRESLFQIYRKTFHTCLVHKMNFNFNLHFLYYRKRVNYIQNVSSTLHCVIILIHYLIIMQYDNKNFNTIKNYPKNDYSKMKKKKKY